MTVTDATAVNTLLHWITGTPSRAGGIPDPDAALAAANTLARAAFARLGAGVRGTGDLDARWPAVPPHADADARH